MDSKKNKTKEHTNRHLFRRALAINAGHLYNIPFWIIGIIAIKAYADWMKTIQDPNISFLAAIAYLLFLFKFFIAIARPPIRRVRYGDND